MPASLTDDEIGFIKQTIHRIYGETAIIRNFGPDLHHIQLHIEADRDVAAPLSPHAGRGLG